MDEIREALKTMTDRELYDLQQLVEQEWKQRFMETLLAETPNSSPVIVRKNEGFH